MNLRKPIIWPAAALLLVALTRPEAIACTACFGQSDSPMAKGMNMGIFTLLLVIPACSAGWLVSLFT